MKLINKMILLQGLLYLFYIVGVIAIIFVLGFTLQSCSNELSYQGTSITQEIGKGVKNIQNEFDKGYNQEKQSQ